MADLQLSTMRTAVRTRLGVPATDGFFTDAQVTDIINEALQIFATEYDWPWLKTQENIATVAGTGSYTPTSGWYRTKALTINNENSMQKRSLQEIREFNTDETGIPEVYCEDAGTLLLRPVPDQVYTVVHDYYKFEPELVDDADVPLVPAQYRWAIVELACHIAHLRQGDETRAERSLAAYGLWISKILDNRRRTSPPTRVRVRPGHQLV